jgi:hypothetical protein
MDKQQKAAYDAVRSAHHKGLLSRPSSCEKCGEAERFGTDGRTLLHGHHVDYAKPLDVEWLCAKCHRKETRLPTGENNGNAILSSKLVRAAILLHEEGFNLSDIAEFYNVSRQAISHAVTGKNWLAERAK